MGTKEIIVVGGGLGGLATALRLAHRGHKVTILEKTDQIGGRNRATQVNGCEFDAGPTLLMMLDPFRKLFDDVGERLEDHLELSLCDPNYRVFFQGGDRIDCGSNMAKMVSELRRFSGEQAAQAFPGMLGDFADLYHASIERFVRRNYDSPLPLASPKSAAIALRHGMLGNLHRTISRHFEDPRLRILFSLQTMYLGLSPAKAPAVYAVLVYMEYGEGIWYPKGGMAEISRVVARLAESRGATIRLNSPVCRMSGKEVILECGERLSGDAVICNADLPYAEKALLGRKPKRKYRYSCSAYMMYIDYEGELPDLLHHNIVIGKDFYGNLDQIFNRLQMPEDPAFYACLSCRAEPSKAPEGHLNLFLLVPCPNLGHPFTEADANLLQAKVFERLTNEFGFDQSKIRGLKTVSPLDWQADLNLDLGAAFGLGHDFFQSVCFRPSNKSRSEKGLYFVGASTVPGNGLPMVLISAELAERRLLEDGVI